MVRVAAALRERFSARLLLQVHDELVVEAPQDQQVAIAEMMRSVMEGVVELRVPLVADVATGASLADAKP